MLSACFDGGKSLSDYTGSGAETATICGRTGGLSSCFALDGPPKIVRLYGRGTIVTAEDARYAELASLFPANPGTRAIVHVAVTPRLDFLRVRRSAL